MKPKPTWQGLPVALLKGGVNGKVHFRGVGLVRYGAEREASIQQLLASDPEAIADDELRIANEEAAPGSDHLAGYFRQVAISLRKLLLP